MPDVLFEIRDQVAHLTLNRPEKLNAFNRSDGHWNCRIIYLPVTKMIPFGPSS